MVRPLPSLDLLVGFEAAARHLSFSKAGEEVFVTQSAISRQVKKLEEYLGMALFERRHRALELTEEGRILFEVVSDSLARLSDTVESLREDPLGRSIKVSTTNAFASLWLVPRLAYFRAQHPNVALHVVADNRTVDLKRDVVDVAIRYCVPSQGLPGQAIRLCSEDIFPVCSPALLNRSGRLLNRVEDLRHHTLLHLADPKNEWPWLQWSNWLEGVGADIRSSDAGIRFSHFAQAIQAAMMGHGIALGASPLVDYLLEEGTLVAPLGQRLASPRAYFLLQNARSNTSVRAFTDWLQTTMEQAISSAGTARQATDGRS